MKTLAQESGDDARPAGVCTLTIDYRGGKLPHVADMGGVLPELIAAMEKEQVAFQAADFEHGQLECLNDDVVVLRGDALKALNLFLERRERRLGSAGSGTGGGAQLFETHAAQPAPLLPAAQP